MTNSVSSFDAKRIAAQSFPAILFADGYQDYGLKHAVYSPGSAFAGEPVELLTGTCGLTVQIAEPDEGGLWVGSITHPPTRNSRRIFNDATFNLGFYEGITDSEVNSANADLRNNALNQVRFSCEPGASINAALTIRVDNDAAMSPTWQEFSAGKVWQSTPQVSPIAHSYEVRFSDRKTNRAITGNYVTGAVAILNATDGSVVAQATLALGVFHFAFDSRRQQFWVTGDAGNQIYCFDAMTGALIETINLGTNQQIIDFGFSGSFSGGFTRCRNATYVPERDVMLFTVYSDANGLLEMTPDSRTFSRYVDSSNNGDGTLGPVWYDRRRDRYICPRAGSGVGTSAFVLVDAASFAVTGVVELPDNPHEGEISLVNDSLYVAMVARGAVAKFDLATLTQQWEFALPACVFARFVPEQNAVVATAWGQQDVFFVDNESGLLLQQLPTGATNGVTYNVDRNPVTGEYWVSLHNTTDANHIYKLSLG